MDLRLITEKQKKVYDTHVSHIMQSWQWGEFRKKMGVKLLRYGLYKNNKLTLAFQISFHKIPLTSYYVGYLPKGPFPSKELSEVLSKIGSEQNCAFIKLESDIEKFQISSRQMADQIDRKFTPSSKPLFTKHNFILDLTKTEQQLLEAMHSKTRYNIKLAKKKGVKVEIRDDDKALEIYLKLYFETTKRQKYLGHNESYHKKVWKTLKEAKMARFLIGYYQKTPLVAWMLINFKDTLYYPYGGSTTLHKDVMANNLVAWEAIKLGKSLNLKKLDFWGALGPNASPKDPWQGFHRFKAGYGGKLVEYLGTFDLILKPIVYQTFAVFDKNIWLKALLLKLVG